MVSRFRLSPAALLRVSLAAAALWFFGVCPCLLCFNPGLLPKERRPRAMWPSDFEQYYMGAVAARFGWWDALYPVVNHAYYAAPSGFEPRYKTFLFDPARRPQPICFYEPPHYPKGGSLAPKLDRFCPELKEGFLYAYSPPLALLVSPLARWDIRTAAFKVWPVLGTFALFGAAFFASRIYRLLNGGPGYGESAVVLAILFYSWRGDTEVVYDGNVTPMLTCLIAFAVYAWLKRWHVALGTAMIPLILFKMITLTWCPMLLLRSLRWKTLGALAFWTALLNAATLWLAGPGVYRTFFTEIAPRLDMPIGIGLPSRVFEAFGFFSSRFYHVLYLAGLLPLYFGYWRSQAADRPLKERQAGAAAALAGTLALFCVLNFSIWPTYFPNYLYFPFAGWLLWEALSARGAWKGFVCVVAALGFVLPGANWILRGLLFRFGGLEAALAFNRWVVEPCFIGLLPACFYLIALRRLFGGWRRQIMPNRLDWAPFSGSTPRRG